jgi:hypothetical protein
MRRTWEGLYGDVLGIVLSLLCDAHPYRAQKTRAPTIASPRHASILRRTRDHASGAGLSASMRNGVGASDKLRLVLPNTTLSAVVHAIVLQVKRSGVTIQKHLPTARDRRMAGGCLAQKKKTGGPTRLQGAVRSRLADAERSRQRRANRRVEAVGFRLRLMLSGWRC